MAVRSSMRPRRRRSRFLLKEIVIEGEGRGDVGLAGKGDEADAVVGAVIDKFGEDLLGEVDAVDAAAANLEILGGHAAGEVDGDNDVHAAGLDLGFAFDEAGLGEGDDEKGEG